MNYNNYDYGNFIPNQLIPPLETPNFNQNTYTKSQLNDMNERMNRLERQIKRIDQRLTRIETPYQNPNQYFKNEPDNNMYMM